MTLNSISGMTIGFREFANNSFNIWSDSGIYNIKTTVYTVPSPNPTPRQPPRQLHPFLQRFHRRIQLLLPNNIHNSFNYFISETFRMKLFIIIAFTAIIFFCFTFFFWRGYIKVEVVESEITKQKLIIRYSALLFIAT